MLRLKVTETLTLILSLTIYSAVSQSCTESELASFARDFLDVKERWTYENVAPGAECYGMDLNIPQTDGRFSQTGGGFPQIDGRFAQTDGGFPQTSGRFPQIGGRFPQADNRFV